MKHKKDNELYKGGDSILFSAIVVGIAGLAGSILILVALILNLIK